MGIVAKFVTKQKQFEKGSGVLDDLKMIHSRDAQDSLGVAQKQWQQLKYSYQLENPLAGIECQNIVLAGMGGSALAATLLHTWPGLSRPFEIVRDYELPAYVGPDTLFIASSYSGNTEETLAALAAAEAKGAQIVVIAAGGKLGERAKEHSYPFYEVPAGLQPRMAVFYNFAGLVQLFEAAGLIAQGSLDELHRAADWLGTQSASLLADVPTAENRAKQIALELMGSSVVIYGGPKLFPAAYKWKINFNENSKTIAWCNQIPEFNHNEFVGWTSHPVDKPYKVVDLRSSFEHERVNKRFEISERLLSGLRPVPEVIQAEGDSVLTQLLWTIQLGDFVSLYLALLNGLNPTPVELIEKLKTALND